ncbi:amidase domain-containing protein [Acetobacterium bakii]|uniref:amidase domain-containing protein n=1 Tax=Acetobacterium bakii TaxID=52689 RepID=UPI0006803F9A|nr:amidase domain-containing protein [Acetobacterium bakii]
MKRRKFRLKKKFRNAVIGMVVIFVTVMGVACVNAASNPLGLFNSDTEKEEVEGADKNREIIVRSGEEDVNDAMMAPIIEYFEVSFNALADLKSTDITGLFADSTDENAQINQGALDYLIGLRLSQSNDLHINNYLCGLSITDVSNDDGLIEVTLEEDHTLNFAFTKEVDSSSSGIEHSFFLEETSAGYVIVAHTKEEDIFLLIEEAADYYGYSPSMISELLSEAAPMVMELAGEKETFNEIEADLVASFADNPYIAADAVDYAMTWVDSVDVIRNEDEFGVYDGYGGNCNNYISQCLNAGGIPMDYLGDYDTQWKWYGDTVNEDEDAYGRSPSWAGVEEFYTYASENTGYGLEAVVGDNVYSGTVGDILQYANNGEWVHSVIITQVVKDDQENVLDYLINSNTTDRINYPASAYGYAELRLIKIMGWNEE